MASPLFDALFAAGAPDAAAMEWEATRLSRAELLAASGRWANAYRHLGVKPGDRILASIEKSAANLIAYLGALRAGAVWVPLNPTYTDAELAFFLGDCAPALTLASPGRAEGLSASGARPVETLDEAGEGSIAGLAASMGDRSPTTPRTQSDLAAICYTSGTTGRSKGAMLSIGNLLSNAQTLAGLWRFSERDILIHALPLFHVHGLFVACHVSLLSGAALILQPRFSPAAVIEAMERASVLMGVPTFYTRLLAEPGLDRERAGRMRLFISGSAPLLASTHAAWRERTGAVILERYGLTETGMDASNPCQGERVAGTVGPPLPDVDLRVVGEEGRELLAGEVGMVEVKGPNVFSGYWGDPEKSRAAFTADGFFITGDLGRLDEAGYLSIVGRAKDLVISGGLNITPLEVEREIDAIQGVVESALVGLPHADLGEAAVAFVVADPACPLDEAAILSAIAPRLARYKQPRRIVFVPQLPRNAMGKVQKAELRRSYARLFD